MLFVWQKGGKNGSKEVKYLATLSKVCSIVGLYLDQFNMSKKRAMIDRLSHEYNRRLYVLETEQYGDTFFAPKTIETLLRNGIDR